MDQLAHEADERAIVCNKLTEIIHLSVKWSGRDA